MKYRFHAEYVEDDLKPGQWALWAGELEHPDGTMQPAFCQGSYEGLDAGMMSLETLEDEDGKIIELPEFVDFS